MEKGTVHNYRILVTTLEILLRLNLFSLYNS